MLGKLFARRDGSLPLWARDIPLGGLFRMPSSLTPAQRSLLARLAAHRSWAVTPDPAARTAPARQRFDQRFLDEVDPQRILSEAERRRRAEHAKKAYFSALALKSSKARARKAGRSK
jgi:hypothetical protein